MDNFQPDTGSAFNPHQMSGNPDNDEQRAERRVVLHGVLAAVGLMFALAGIGIVMANKLPHAIAVAAAFILIGLTPSVWWIFRGCRRLVLLRRIHVGQCVHCKYETRVLRKGKCPECGKDPFEPE
jgi:hypothetical protein